MKDLLRIADLLSPDERLVRDSVRRFVDTAVLPGIRGYFEDHRFPRELIGEMAQIGLLGSSLEGYGCAGLNATSYGVICQELERGEIIGCFGLTEPHGGSDPANMKTVARRSGGDWLISGIQDADNQCADRGRGHRLGEHRGRYPRVSVRAWHAGLRGA